MSKRSNARLRLVEEAGGGVAAAAGSHRSHVHDPELVVLPSGVAVAVCAACGRVVEPRVGLDEEVRLLRAVIGKLRQELGVAARPRLELVEMSGLARRRQ